MVVSLRFSSAALLSCRFATSPVHETLAAVRLLTRPSSAGHHGPWLQAVEPALDRLDLSLLSVLTPRLTYGPDFLSPPPGGPATSFEAELASVAATPPARVRREIDRCLSERYGNTRPAVAEALRGRGERARSRCVDALQAAWSELVEPWWPRIRAVLDADIGYRSRLLADAGLAAVLTDLHPGLSWSGQALSIDINHDEEHQVGSSGIVLLPGAFTSLGLSYDPPAVEYTARGIAAMWTGPPAASAATAHLLGARRAALLAALDEPASTTGLASRCDAPVSSVSEHLAVLREAGLITTHRTGRHLQHSRTPLGSALVHVNAAPPA